MTKKTIVFLISLIAPMLAVFFVSGTGSAGSGETAENTVLYVPVNTEVDYGLSGFMKRAVLEAKEKKVNAIVLGIDTFGGRVDATMEIVNHIDLAGDIPVYAFIEDKAWSAGALIAFACKKIYMKPGSSIGSAAPVSGGSVTEAPKALDEKYVSALAAKFRSVAEKNSYPPDIAAAMVDKDLEIKEVLIDGKTLYVTDDRIEAEKANKKKVVIKETIDKKDKLLNLTAKLAEKYGVASGVVKDLQELMRAAGLEKSIVLEAKRNWAEHLAGFVTSSMVSGLLFMIGIIAVYYEITHPGFGIAGIGGILCLGLIFWGKYIVNLAQLTEIILFVAGAALLFIEIFLIPGFGAAGIAGIGLMIIGTYLAFVPFVLPTQPWDFSIFQETMLVLFIGTITGITGFLVLVHYMQNIPVLNRLVLMKEQKDDDGYTVADPETLKLLGTEGVSITDLHPVGKAKFGDKVYDVVCETSYLHRDSKIKVIDIKGNRILVRQA